MADEDRRPIVGEDESVYRHPMYTPRPAPSLIPAVGIFDEPTVGFCINAEWAVHFRGVFDALDQPDTWIGTEEEVFAARQQLNEAFLMFMEDCMADPCCPETNTLLAQIVVLLETNELNQAEIIDQNNTTIYNQYAQHWENFVTNNTYQQTLNNQLYDGTPQSIAPSAGTDFSDGTGNSEAKLCAAIQDFINQQLYTYGMQANLIAGAAGIGATAFIALGTALAVFTAGASLIAGAAIASLILAGSTVWNNILNDVNAQRKVRCCMFDALRGQPITLENFQSSFDGCGFDSGSNEATLAQQLANSVANYPDDYLAFLRFYQAAQNTGNISECDCCSDIEDYELVAVNNCIITQIDETHFRIEQTVVSDGPNDPFCGDYNYFFAEFKESQDRCVNVNGVSGTALAGWLQTDCAGIEHEGPGGGGGDGLLFKWWSKACPPDTTTMDIIVVIACPSD